MRLNPALLFVVLPVGAAHADEPTFSTGPLIEAYGPAADVEIDALAPTGETLKLAFDVSERAEVGENRTLISAARFLNMHARHGVEPANMSLAIVVHGEAVRDVTGQADNPNRDLIAALVANGVQLYVCGQSAAYHGVSNADLAPGVAMALSAMTAHAMLQKDGYALNPF